MARISQRVHDNVHMFGDLLGQTMKDQRGEGFLEKVERIRTGAKSARRGSQEGRKQLEETLAGLSEDELLPVARGFSQFLNLANIADQYHLMRRRRDDDEPAFEDQMLAQVLERLKANEF